MEREIQAAAAWWADQLRDNPAHDNGDGFQTVAMNALLRYKPLPEEQIEAFRAALAGLIRELVTPTWPKAEQDPLWGGACRIVATDYGPDLTLEEAAKRAGFHLGMRLPVKTVMWINPGEVKISSGYKVPISSLPMETPT